MRAVIAGVLLSLSSVVAAQPPQPPRPPSSFTASAFRYAGERVVEMEQVFRNERSTIRLRAGGAWKQVYRGPGRTVVLAARPGWALLTVVHEGGVTLVAAPVSDGGAIGDVQRHSPRAERSQQYSPYTAVATADAEGFTVLWQEMGMNRSAQTFMVQVDGRGRLRGQARLVQVPWALAAIAATSRGYHLALYYDGAGPGQTRLSMVSLSRDGRPEQHPDWSSQPGMLDEVQLASSGNRVWAVYRGGANGEQLLRRDVTQVGNWGRDPGPAQNLGRISAEQEVLVRVEGERVQVERR